MTTSISIISAFACDGLCAGDDVWEACVAARQPATAVYKCLFTNDSIAQQAGSHLAAVRGDYLMDCERLHECVENNDSARIDRPTDGSPAVAIKTQGLACETVTVVSSS